MERNVVSFQSGEEEKKILGYIADSSSHHITSESGSALGSRNRVIERPLSLSIVAYQKFIGLCHQL